MEISKIRELRLAKPFHPFTLILDDGRNLAVELPYTLAIARSGKELALASTEGIVFLKPSHVSKVTLRETASN